MKSYLYIIAATLAMAVEYILIKSAKDISGLLMGIIIFLTAGILLATMAVRQRAENKNWMKLLPGALTVGVIGSCCNLLWIYGTKMTSVANSSALGRMDVIFTLLLALIIFGEKIPLKSWLFILSCLIGGALMMNISNITFSSSENLGNALIIGAALILSLNSFLIKKLSAPFGPARLAAVNCGVNVIIFCIAFVTTESFNLTAELSWQRFMTLLACGVCSFVFFAGYYTGIKTIPVWQIRIITLSAPVFTAIGGIVFLNEAISNIQVTGMTMVLLSAGAMIKLGKNKFDNKINKLNKRFSQDVELLFADRG